MASKFQRTYNKTDFGLTADVALVANQWTEFGRVTVPAQQEIGFGNGQIANGVDSRGLLFVDLKSNDVTPIAVNAKVRLVVANATQTNEYVIFEERSERLRASSSDRTQAPLLGESAPRARQDSLLLLKAYCTTAEADTIGYDSGETTMFIPVTVYQ